MGRATWFDADGTKRGGWTDEEDQKLVAYINEYGIGDWRFLPRKAGNIYILPYIYSYTIVLSISY